MKKYITATGKEVLTVLRSAAGLIPVPMLQDAIEIALKIIELCEVRQRLQAVVWWLMRQSLLGVFSRRTEGQGSARQGRPSHDPHSHSCHRRKRGGRQSQGGELCENY